VITLAAMSRAEIVSGLRQKWLDLSLAKKVAAGILAVALICTLFIIVRALSRPKMAPLFTELEASDAARVTERLKELGVAYTLASEGRSILVPEDKVYDLRIQLAGDGTLLASGTGFELFDETKLGATDFSRRIDYQRALQEELRRTIVQIDEVEQARVHLAIPEPSVFIEETAAPSASILLKLKPYAKLSELQVRGIINLVAGSVEKLSPEAITIVDTQGNILSSDIARSMAEQLAEATNEQLAVRRSFERELEQRLQNLLDRVLGPGQSIAMLTAELDFNSTETTLITFGEEGVPRSQQVIREEWAGSGSFTGGEAGTGSNIPGYVVGGESGESTYSRTEETTNYEIDETREKQILAPGRLQRLHTAVVINSKDNNLSEAQIRQIEETVAAAIGYQEERGDSISVSAMDFDTSHIEAALEDWEKAQKQERLERYITLGAIALAALILLIFVLRFLAKRRERLLDEELAALPEVPVEEKEEAELAPEEIMSSEQQTHKRVRQLADKEPEAVAFLIRAWLAED